MSISRPKVIRPLSKDCGKSGRTRRRITKGADGCCGDELTHFAVAMKYNPEEMSAPVVVAKGQDLVAFKIREIAEENDITIVENKPLAQALYFGVDIDEEVPEEHYKAVAEIISYVWNLKGRVMPAEEMAQPAAAAE